MDKVFGHAKKGAAVQRIVVQTQHSTEVIASFVGKASSGPYAGQRIAGDALVP
jgi:hypothetical protein